MQLIIAFLEKTPFFVNSITTLGCEMEVPTLQGKALLKIPSGTQAGRIFRMSRKGIPDVNGRGVGDQLVQILLWNQMSKLLLSLIQVQNMMLHEKNGATMPRHRLMSVYLITI